MKRVSKIFTGILALGLTGMAFGQAADTVVKVEDFETLKGKVESLNEGFLTTKATVDKLAKIKVSGYIQGQWQLADTIGGGVSSAQGGSFPANSNQRLQLRRVRLKTTYDAGTSLYIVELEARPTVTNVGTAASPAYVPTGVSVKDVEVVLVEPWLKTFTLGMGLQDRPFGYEIGYSSGTMETPERSRGENVVFNGEKDLGVVLGINPTDRMGIAQYFTFKGGLFTGTGGYNGGSGDEIDSTLDFIGRAGFKLPFYDLNLAVDGGVSYYAGHVLSLNDSAFEVNGTARTVSTGNLRKTLDRNILGLDMQVYYTIPVIGDWIGGSSVRGEWWSGNTPGTIGSSGPYGLSSSVNPVFDRNFQSWYLTWVQNYGTKVQSVVRYDQYDPNTDVEGKDIGIAANALNAADVKFSTLGFGLHYYWDDAVRLTAYYDVVTNETVNAAATGTLANFKKDLNDNVFTLRAQVRF